MINSRAYRLGVDAASFLDKSVASISQLGFMQADIHLHEACARNLLISLEEQRSI